MSDFDPGGLPTRFGFLLLDQFTLMPFAAALEPLRLANRICQQTHYSWTTISESGEIATSSDGIEISTETQLDNRNLLSELDIIIVCGGTNVERHVSGRLLSWLRQVKKKGLALGAVCTGSYVLAQAGLLDDYRCSIHWENMSSLRELFPNVAVSRSLYTIDRDRFTSAGGTSAIDMLVHMVSVQCGPEIGADIADLLIHERIRSEGEAQRLPLGLAMGHLSPKLTIAVEIMQANIRDAISQSDLANYAGLSQRQLQRLFKSYLGYTPTRYYQQLRLQRAKELLLQTNKSLIEISQLTGFISTSHFSKSYRKYFGYSPSSERQPL